MQLPDAKTWKTVMELFDAVTEKPQGQREAFITQLQIAPDIETWLRRLLVGDERSEGLLDAGVTLMADQLFDNASKSIVETDWIGREFGAYRSISELGRGGASVVLLAERIDGRFEKQVAIKLSHGARSRRLTREQIAAEAKILARLEHPNIAHIIDAGLTEEDMPFTVMEYCDGTTITQYCEQQQLTIDARLQLLQKICSAVHYAHRNLVVHCDLKPANILVQSDGEPKILDFDIASRLDETETQTKLALQLTPVYAAPEQFSADQGVTTATDIYALGIIAYEVLCGQRPFSAQQQQFDHLRQVKLDNDYVLPSECVLTGLNVGQAQACGLHTAKQLARKLHGDVDAIISQAMRADPSQRYPSMQALANDIERYFNKESINARPGSHGYRLKRWLQRHVVATIATAAVLLSLVAGLAIALWQADVARQQADLARQNALNAETTQTFLLDIFETADPWVNQQTPITVDELMQQGVKKITASLPRQSPVKGGVLSMLGDIQSFLGNDNLALELYQQALDILKETNAPNEELIEPYDGMRLAHSYLFQFEEAKAIAQTMLELVPIESGVTNEAVMARIAMSASMLGLNEFEPAIAFMRETLSYRSEIERLDTAPQLLGVELMQLGDALAYSDQLEPGLAANLEAEPFLIEAFGEVSADYAQNLSVRSSIYAWLGDYEKFLTGNLRILEISQEIFPANHPRILSARSNVATAYLQLGQYDEALALYEDNLPKYIDVYGEHAVNTQILKGNMGAVELSLRNIDHSIEYYQSAIDSAIEFGTDKEFRAGISRAGLADALAEKGEHELAREQYLQAKTLFEDTLGEKHFRSLLTSASLAYHYYQTQEYTKGHELAEQVYMGILDHYGENSRYGGYVFMLRGLFKVHVGDIEKGMQLLTKAKKILQDIPGAEKRYTSQLEVVDELLRLHGYQLNKQV